MSGAGGWEKAEATEQNCGKAGKAFLDNSEPGAETLEAGNADEDAEAMKQLHAACW